MISEDVVCIVYHPDEPLPSYLREHLPAVGAIDTIQWLRRPSKQLRAAVEQSMVPSCKEYLCIPTEPEPVFPEMIHRFSVRISHSPEVCFFFEEQAVDAFSPGTYSEIYYHCRPTRELRARAKELGLREYYCIQPLDIED